MTKYLLITRPEHDDTTHYLSNWSVKAIDLARSKGIDVLDLHRDKANKKEVEGRIEKLKPRLMVFNGHGDTDTIAGHQNQPLIKAGENEHLLNSTITYAISCSSAKSLGQKSIDSGAISYIGFDDDFIFAYAPALLSRPLADETAGLFLEPSQELMISLVKSNTVHESYARARTVFKEHIMKLLSSATSEDDAKMLRFLRWDFVHLKHLGDPEATF